MATASPGLSRDVEMVGRQESMGRSADKAAVAGRLTLIRRDLYGEGGVVELAGLLGLPPRTWANYEAGVTIPGEVLLRFLAITGAEPVWMLHGDGPRYRTG